MSSIDLDPKETGYEHDIAVAYDLAVEQQTAIAAAEYKRRLSWAPQHLLNYPINEEERIGDYVEGIQHIGQGTKLTLGIGKLRYEVRTPADDGYFAITTTSSFTHGFLRKAGLPAQKQELLGAGESPSKYRLLILRESQLLDWYVERNNSRARQSQTYAMGAD